MQQLYDAMHFQQHADRQTFSVPLSVDADLFHRIRQGIGDISVC